MGAELVHHADTTQRVAKRNEPLAKQFYPHRRAIGRGDFRRQRRDRSARINTPIGVPGPVRVRKSFCSRVVMDLQYHGFRAGVNCAERR